MSNTTSTEARRKRAHQKAGQRRKKAMSKKSTVADHCRAGTCDAEGASAASDGRRFVTLANVAGVVGVVGLGAAGWWFATSTESAGERRAVLGYAGKLP